MKTKIVLTTLAALLCVQLQSFTLVGDSASTASMTLREQIVQLAENLPLDKTMRMAENVHLCFKVNTDGTVELAEVQTKNKALAATLKSAFDGAALNVSSPLETEYYWITIKYMVV